MTTLDSRRQRKNLSKEKLIESAKTLFDAYEAQARKNLQSKISELGA